jgi:hypothetical protein
MTDLGMFIAAVTVERMRDRVYGALTHGPETQRPIQERRRRNRRFRFGFRRPGRSATQTIAPRTA